jgi:hypothetical protein
MVVDRMSHGGDLRGSLVRGFVLHYFQFLAVSFELDADAGASVGDFRD